MARSIPASEAIIAKHTATNHAASMPSANRRVPSAGRMARRRTGACRLLSRRTKSGVSSLILSSLPPCHTHATSWLTDTHTIPFRGRVCVWRFRYYADPMRSLSRLRQCLTPTNPSLATNHSKCQTSSRMRTRPFIPDPTTALPQHVLVPVRCIVFRFRFYFGFIISARQRTLTNADERTIRI